MAIKERVWTLQLSQQAEALLDSLQLDKLGKDLLKGGGGGQSAKEMKKFKPLKKKAEEVAATFRKCEEAMVAHAVLLKKVSSHGDQGGGKIRRKTRAEIS